MIHDPMIQYDPKMSELVLQFRHLEEEANAHAFSFSFMFMFRNSNTGVSEFNYEVHILDHGSSNTDPPISVTFEGHLICVHSLRVIC